jgi:hypothetical protein
VKVKIANAPNAGAIARQNNCRENPEKPFRHHRYGLHAIPLSLGIALSMYCRIQKIPNALASTRYNQRVPRFDPGVMYASTMNEGISPVCRQERSSNRCQQKGKHAIATGEAELGKPIPCQRTKEEHCDGVQ